MTARNKLTVVAAPQPPAKIDRTYSDFDRMIRVIDMLDYHWRRLDKCSEELNDAISAIQEGLDDHPPRAPSQKPNP